MVRTEEPAIAAVERIVRKAGRVQTNDLDWEAARAVGLTEDEAFIIGYFADVESQTLVNLKTLLALRGALEPVMVAFLTTWNYEEFFHGQALARLLRESGRPVPETRVADCEKHAGAKERLERVLMPLASRGFSQEFPAVYMTFGALHELTTLRGYERLARSAKNPVLRTLSTRIARQERRHFAFYFNQAQNKLSQNHRAQWLTRMLLTHYFAPVGAGLMGSAACEKLYRLLFPGHLGQALCADVDERMGRLPGLAGLMPMSRYFSARGAPNPILRLVSRWGIRSRIGQGADAR